MSLSPLPLAIGSQVSNLDEDFTAQGFGGGKENVWRGI